MVTNKCDQHQHQEEERILREKYPQIVGFYRVSCLKGVGLRELAQALRQFIPTVPDCETPFPHSWSRIKNALERATVDYTQRQNYRNLCVKAKVADHTEQDILLTFLNDLGIILHYPKLAELNTTVLNPEWLTYAVYRLVMSEKTANCGGLLSRAEISEILSAPNPDGHKFPVEKHDFILRVMEQFELCYFVDRDRHRLLIPDLLYKDVVPHAFKKEGALCFRYRFEFLPRSVFPRFLVRSQKEAGERILWRTGAVLQDQETDGQTLIQTDYDSRTITLWVQGSQRRLYLERLRERLRQILDQFFNFTYLEEVRLHKGTQNTWVSYNELLGLEILGQKNYASGTLRALFPLEQLLDTFQRKETRQKEAARQDREFRMEGRGDIYFNPQINPVINVNPTLTANGGSVQQTFHQPLFQGLQNDLSALKEELLDEMEDPKERLKLEKELQRMEKTLAEAQQIEDPTKLKESGLLERVERFVTKAKDKGTRIGQVIHSAEDGAHYLQRMTEKVTGLLDWASQVL